jgi:hypothetical protein
MRMCPLAYVVIPCSESAPLCPWCASRPEYAALAEDRMGELLTSTVQHQGGRPKENGIVHLPFLRDIGVTKVESSNAQKFHALPDDLKSAVIEGKTPKAEAASQGTAPASEGTRERLCVDCNGAYRPTSPRQQRCQSCGVEHTRKKNLEYQHAFRARHRTAEEAERLQRRAWRLDGMKSRAESLHADGLSPSAIAVKLGCSHHTVLKHLAQPEARWRVDILRRTNVPEPELPC